MSSGRVVVLNGTSSAGKTTLATMLQTRLADAGKCWVIIGIDDFFAKLPFAWVRYGKHVGVHAEEGIAFELVNGEIERRLGPIGAQILAAYRGAVGSAARAGLNVIVDEVLLSEEDWNAWQAELRGLDALWVRVDVDLDVLEARERMRSDRVAGIARSQYDIVHRYPTYGARVDTGTMDPATEAVMVLAVMQRS